jgi:hypothetical protein
LPAQAGPIHRVESGVKTWYLLKPNGDFHYKKVRINGEEYCFLAFPVKLNLPNPNIDLPTTIQEGLMIDGFIILTSTTVLQDLFL